VDRILHRRRLSSRDLKTSRPQVPRSSIHSTLSLLGYVCTSGAWEPSSRALSMFAFMRPFKSSRTLLFSVRGSYRLSLTESKSTTSVSYGSSRQVNSKSSNSPPRPFSSTAAKMATFPTPSKDPPKHEMAYFPQMTTSYPSKNGEFRRVLWTGLYSQLVLMNVPVGGEIGDEVRVPAVFD